jgi:hypothetical protein
MKSIAVLLLAVAALPHVAQAAAELRVIETWPVGDTVTLGTNQNYYLRIGYVTDEPVHIWARPYYRGDEVAAGSNPSPVYTGTGEALGWFFFMEEGERVDEIRINVGDGSSAGTRLAVTYPVDVRAGSAAATGSEPAWLTALLQENERLMRDAYEKRMSEPAGAGDALIAGGFMLAVLALGIGSIAVPILAMRRWSGGWRVAAAVPVCIIGFVVLRIVIDTSRDPTSHNLWPFEILQAGAVSLVLIGVLYLARKLLLR